MQVRLAQDLAAALQHLQRAVAFDVDGETDGDVRDRLQGAAVFDLVDGGRAIGAFALKVEEGRRRRVRCLAAGAEPGHQVLPAIVEFTEREARERIGAASIQCETCRPGMVRQLEREGFRVAGYILTKDIR